MQEGVFHGIQDDEAVYRLIEAMVVSAAEDVRYFHRQGKETYKAKSHQMQVYHERVMIQCERAERFFKSEWFTFLTGMDGADIVRRIKEMEDEQAGYATGRKTKRSTKGVL